MNASNSLLFTMLLLTMLCQNGVCFSPEYTTRSLRRWGSAKNVASRAAFVNHQTSSVFDGPVEEVETSSQIVRAPLKFIGPYPCLGLKFPNLSTKSQKQRNVTGVALDFVVDTAANTNTIQQQVATELELKNVGHALPGVGSAGIIRDGGETYFLGDAQLDGIVYEEDEAPFTFMTDLSASALPIASPAAAGLLSLPFFEAFHGGLEMTWGDKDTPASVVFYGDKSVDDVILANRNKVSIKRISITQLPTVTISINGVEMPALLDTGSPFTVLNMQAARAAGVESIVPYQKSTNNPIANFANRFQQAQAASKGDAWMIMGTNGTPVSLLKSKEKASILIASESKVPIDFGSVSVYVGELPGLAALNGIGIEAPPAVVLGMDVLRQKTAMLLRLQDNEVWF